MDARGPRRTTQYWWRHAGTVDGKALEGGFGGRRGSQLRQDTTYPSGRANTPAPAHGGASSACDHRGLSSLMNRHGSGGWVLDEGLVDGRSEVPLFAPDGAHRWEVRGWRWRGRESMNVDGLGRLNAKQHSPQGGLLGQKEGRGENQKSRKATVLAEAQRRCDGRSYIQSINSTRCVGYSRRWVY